MKHLRLMLWLKFCVICIFGLLTTTAAFGAVTGPTNVGSTSHSISVSSTVNQIKMTWTAATSDNSLVGYATVFSEATSYTPVTQTASATATSMTSAPLSDGTYYFYIRGIDNDTYPNNYGTVTKVGPFIIDTSPDVSAITPSSGSNGSSTSVQISGTSFMTGATVKVGTTDLTNVVVSSSTLITATVPSGIQNGTYDVEVTNPNQKKGTLASAFTVQSSNSPPEVDAYCSEQCSGAGDGDTTDDFSGTVNSQKTLSGWANDADVGDTLTWTWSISSAPTGSTATIANPNSETNATITPDVVGSYTIKLTVGDGTVNVSDESNMVVSSGTNNTPTLTLSATETSVAISEPVSLTGTVTDNGGTSWTPTWAISSKPTGSTASLTPAGEATSLIKTATFTPDVAGNYTVSLYVTDDGSATSSTKTVTIRANGAPVANAGVDQEALTDATVTLDASASSDPNAGTTLTYTWTVTSVPNGYTSINDLVLADSDSNTYTLTAAANPVTFSSTVAGDYTFTVEVNDGSGETNATDSDTIVVTLSSNPPPVAYAGPDQAVTNNADNPFVPVEITVTSAGTNLPSDGSDPVTYTWTFAAVPDGSGYTTTTAVSTASSYSFTTEEGINGTYTLLLEVTDSIAQTDTDLVNIVVSAAYTKGDVDDDGQITAQDAVDAFWLSLGSPTQDEINRADYDEDGSVTAQDAVDIFWASLGQ